MFYLENREGKLSVATRSTHYSEPVEIIVYWDVIDAASAQEFQERFSRQLPLPVTHTPGNPGFYLYLPGQFKSLHLRTPERGEVVEKSYPCPKVRKGTETRYHCGRWQKATKKGWVAA